MTPPNRILSWKQALWKGDFNSNITKKLINLEKLEYMYAGYLYDRLIQNGRQAYKINPDYVWLKWMKN